VTLEPAINTRAVATPRMQFLPNPNARFLVVTWLARHMVLDSFAFLIGTPDTTVYETAPSAPLPDSSRVRCADLFRNKRC
jgi:hypothetical protein